MLCNIILKLNPRFEVYLKDMADNFGVPKLYFDKADVNKWLQPMYNLLYRAKIMAEIKNNKHLKPMFDLIF